MAETIFLKQLLTDSSLSGTYIIDLSIFNITGLQELANYNDFVMFIVDCAGLTNGSELLHMFSDKLHYKKVYYHDAVWYGLFDYMRDPGDIDIVIGIKKGCVIVMYNIDNVLTSIPEDLSIMLDYFSSASSSRRQAKHPLYVLILDKGDNTPSELKNLYIQFGIKSVEQ